MRSKLKAMRRLIFLAALMTSTIAVAPALAGTGSERGFIVSKDYGTYGVTELRDAYTGRVLEASTVTTASESSDCSDTHHTFTGASWREFEPYLVNVDSIPSYLDAGAARAGIAAAHTAWQTPLGTDCFGFPVSSSYVAIDGGDTTAPASLGSLRSDGLNVVAFQSLTGTLCEGALACVIAELRGSKLVEADLLFEADLAAAGFNETWSTDDTTDPRGAVPRRFAIVDVATHEWGHFAGLDHVHKSPGLTMFPFIQDGMQTLGLGDVRGIRARY